jgi:hypothetical protein
VSWFAGKRRPAKLMAKRGVTPCSQIGGDREAIGSGPDDDRNIGKADHPSGIRSWKDPCVVPGGLDRGLPSQKSVEVQLSTLRSWGFCRIANRPIVWRRHTITGYLINRMKETYRQIPEIVVLTREPPPIGS